MTRRELYLHEELLLLALRDREGTVPACAGHFNYGLGGALLAELILSGHVRVVRERKRDYLEPSGRERVDEPVLAECLGRVRSAKRRATLQTWVGRFAGLKQLKHRVAGGLCQLRVLRADEGKVLLIFRRRIYPELDPRPEREVLARLEQAIFGHERDVPERTVAMLALADATGLLKLAFDKKELKRRKQRIRDVVEGDAAGRATRKAIEAVQAAVIAATTAATVAATT